MTAGATVRALMAGAIDYAGLFPPAGLGMPEAVRNYAAYRRGPHAWMLGRFVVPVARLEELASAYATLPVPGDGAWPVSAIARASDAGALAAFNARHGSRLRIDMVESPRATVADVASLAALVPTYEVYAEIDAVDDPATVIAACARHGVGAKIRTGGVTPDAFPTPAQVARFMRACREAGVPFKATAGLHHAWRAEYPLTYASDAARGTMFGFAGVLLAGVAVAGGAGDGELASVLGAPGSAGFALDGRGAVLPSGRAVPAELVAAARRATIRSFGSCSFDEPVQDLAAARLL